MAAGKRKSQLKNVGKSYVKGCLVSMALKNNFNCYTYVVGVDLFNGNNNYVARCRRHTESKYGGQESESTHVAMVFLHMYVANGGVN